MQQLSAGARRAVEALSLLAADGMPGRRVVEEALRRVPEKYRQPLLLEVWEGFSLAEIGIALGLPEGTVKSRLFRAREKFKRQWLKLGGQD